MTSPTPNIVRILLAGFLALGIPCAHASAQQDVPADSLQRIQDIYGRLREHLAETNDDFWHHGDYERCIALNRLMTAMDPQDADSYASGAWLMQNQLRDDEAEAYLRQGLRNNPDAYDLYFELGYFCYMHERFPEAIANLEAAVQFEVPAFVWHMLAHSYEHAGDTSEALNIWLMRESADPLNAVPRIQIERILAGDPPSIAPEMARHAREERARDEKQEPR